MGDPTQIQNALLNMALNSRDAMPEGGTLTFATVSTTVRMDDTRSLGYSMKSGEYLLIQVQDTGTGMDRETLAHMYEPFYTTKGIGKGTGLGLSSVYGCVKNHGGYIHAESEQGKGTVFNVYFPLLREARPVPVPALPKAPETVLIKSAPGKNGHILVVDDEVIVGQLCQTILQDFGYRVSLFSNSKDSVEFFRANHADIDMVILDMIMPQMNGSECFAEMKNIKPDIKAIMATGYDVSERTQKLLTRGIAGFLQKPFRENTLLRMVSDVLKVDGYGKTKPPLRG
jgi:CheY-like chemotaxis protein